MGLTTVQRYCAACDGRNPRMGSGQHDERSTRAPRGLAPPLNINDKR